MRDTAQKPPIFHAMQVGRYRVVDLRAMVVTALELVTAVGPDARVRLEPFDAVELPAWELFGLEDAPG